MSVPFTKPCPECQEDMELVTADDGGEVVVYECPECGFQQEIRVERDDDEDPDEAQPLDPSELFDEDEDVDDERSTADEPE